MPREDSKIPKSQQDVRLTPTGHKKLHMNLRGFLRMLLALQLGLILFGCDSKKDRLDRQKAVQQENVIQKSEELNRGYLRGDVRHAKQCLLDNARLLEEATILEPIGRAQLLSLTYFRTYVLERRNGDEASAAASLIKAQYWSLKKGELTGVEVDKAMQDIGKFSAERIVEYIDEFDRTQNNGKEPLYLKLIHERDTEAK